MILVLGGTSDSRQLAQRLLAKGKEVCYSSLSSMGNEKIEDAPGLNKIQGQLDGNTLRETIIAYDIDLCIDGTHPYAREISENAIWACDAMNIKYLRFERPSHIDEGLDILSFETYEEASDYLVGAMGKSSQNILLTTGSRQLELFKDLPKDRTYIRVLPTAGVLKKCENLGFKTDRILGLQGPFSKELNYAMMKEFNIGFMVTKDSGDVGGVGEKVSAARKAAAKIIFISRPSIGYPQVLNSIDEVIELVTGN